MKLEGQKKSANVRDAGNVRRVNPFHDLASKRSSDIRHEAEGARQAKGGARLPKGNPFAESMNRAKVANKMVSNARNDANRTMYPGGWYNTKTKTFQADAARKGPKPNKFDAKKMRDLNPIQE